MPGLDANAKGIWLQYMCTLFVEALCMGCQALMGYLFPVDYDVLLENCILSINFLSCMFLDVYLLTSIKLIVCPLFQVW